MDFPFFYNESYKVDNSWWFLPTDMYKIEKKQEEINNEREYHPLVDYLSRINNKDKFKYLMVSFVIILFIYRLNLQAKIWIGLMIATIIVYYLNEKQESVIGNQASKLWNVLKSDLLKQTHYFIGNPQLTQWVNDVGELKKYNVIEFNKMIKSLDQMLRLIFDLKRGMRDCKETLDLIRDLKVSSLNQFHSIIHKIPFPELQRKYDYQLKELARHLNDKHAEVIRICKLYYSNTAVNIDSQFDIPSMDDPYPNDPFNDANYQFFN